MAVPNEVHQADLLFLSHDLVGRKTYRYALTVVDVALRYKKAEPLTSNIAAEVADGLARIYKRSPLRWPKLLQVDPGRKFMGAVSQLLAKHSVQVRRGRVDIHRDRGALEQDPCRAVVWAPIRPRCASIRPEVDRVGGSTA